jgi:hypothetical protein
MNTARRRFLQTAGAATVCPADGTALRGLAQFGAEPPPERVRFGPDLEPIVRLMEETPREECVRVFVAELRRTSSPRRSTTSTETGAPIIRSSSRLGKRCGQGEAAMIQSKDAHNSSTEER